MDYRRVWHPGGTYFFTVNLLQRKSNDLLVRHVQALREEVKVVKTRHPFKIHGWVVLPEHMHCVIELLPDDADYATRLMLIKMRFQSLTQDRTAVRCQGKPPGARHLAETILGTPDPGRSRLPGAPGLCPL